MHNSRLQARTRQQLNELSRQAGNTDAVDFFNLLTGPELLELTDAHLPEHRERLYPPTVTLSMFIQQVLSEDGSCQRAVNGWAAQCTAEGLPFQSVRTGGYCRARQRLPLAMVQSLTRGSGDRPVSGQGQQRTRLAAPAAGRIRTQRWAMLADALYCSYWLIASLQAAGIDVVFQQHGSRKTDLRRGQRPGRVEPRACKRRPKRSKWLKVPREQARQQVRKLGYYLPNG